MKKFEFINFYRVTRQSNGTHILITFGCGKSFAISIPIKLILSIALDQPKNKAS